LEEAIEDRIAGYIGKNDFFKKLDLAIEKGGAGFGRKSARNLTNYFEKLISQGA